MVFIPAEFDMVPVDLNSLLVNEATSRIEELQVELEEAKERLKQFSLSLLWSRFEQKWASANQ